MIPKVIHYCWFGGNPLPKSALKCIDSWRKFLPDYEIKEWNESNFDVNIIPYTKEAYEAKKYAFVSDYARFWILYHYGGIYFDTDVEVISPMDDIIAKGPFMGREAGSYLRNICGREGEGLGVNPGLGIGAPSGLSLMGKLINYYHDIYFKNPDGSINSKTIVCYTSEMLVNCGLSDQNSMPELIEGFWIYPSDFFCPMDHTRGNILTITNNTRSIHHYTASWINHYSLRYGLHLMKVWMTKFLGERVTNGIIRIFK